MVKLYILYIELLLIWIIWVQNLTSRSPEQELISLLVLLAKLLLSSPSNTLCTSFRILTWETQEMCKLLSFCFHSKRWRNFWIICNIEKEGDQMTLSLIWVGIHTPVYFLEQSLETADTYRSLKTGVLDHSICNQLRYSHSKSSQADVL